MSENNHKPLHIAMFPWFAFGHITSFLHLANKLAEQGHRISFILPPKTQVQMLSHNHHPHLISFIPITLPPVDGLPTWAETTADVPASSRPLIMTAMDRTQDMIESLLSSLNLDFIFFDFTEWMPGLARKYGVKSVFYATVYAVTVAYLTPQARNLPLNGLMKENLAGPPPGFPCPSIGLKAHEAQCLANASGVQFGGKISLLERAAIAFRECDAMGIKSCREMEGPYCDYVIEHYGKPLLLAGPVVPKLPDSKLDEQLEAWLKSFSTGKGSVVYCALGSECFLKKDQFQELVLGLELTEMPFLAALKLPIDCPTMQSALPYGFTEQTKGRGVVHGGWVQQQLILNHPSVGCFVTHCGSGSLSEGLVSHCQLVMLPQAVDQFLNARMMSQDLKVAVEVEKREGGLITREAVRDAILLVMQEGSAMGREVRENHAKMREFLVKEGVEDSYISSFVQSLYNLRG